MFQISFSSQAYLSKYHRAYVSIRPYHNILRHIPYFSGNYTPCHMPNSLQIARPRCQIDTLDRVEKDSDQRPDIRYLFDIQYTHPPQKTNFTRVLSFDQVVRPIHLVHIFQIHFHDKKLLPRNTRDRRRCINQS